MPKRNKSIERILIIGGSGYLGRALYREFQSFYEAFGTFCYPDEFWENHGAFYNYNSTKD
ncbi:MAG TPA: dTDP-4-dehydrorhamnose reductase, partial [Flavobacteriaceae bacterium]|nr:dTDP-4-dehydrorhamnose reductase [Flavobacteriaceae bacterium]